MGSNHTNGTNTPTSTRHNHGLTITTHTSPTGPQPPEVVRQISAARQCVAFLCGTLVARTRARSPGRLLAVSPLLVEQFGRDWVVRECRDAAFTVDVGGGVCLHCIVWVSLTLGVVGSVQFATAGPERCQLVGCVGSSRGTGMGWGVAPGVGPSGCCCRLLMTRTHRDSGVNSVDVVDGTRLGGEKLVPWWIVLMEASEITLWKLWSAHEQDGADCELDTEETCIKILLDTHPLCHTLHENDPDVLLMTVGNSEVLLWHIDLKESFCKRAIVFKSDHIPVPFGKTVLGGDPICTAQSVEADKFHIHNSRTHQTTAIKGGFYPLSGHLFSVWNSTEDYNKVLVFCTADLISPLYFVDCSTRGADRGFSPVFYKLSLYCGKLSLKEQ
ncbi:hypothetical protein Pelo_5383 [Pelomyxa schiedti]|nr:hypothetical protein Pelo_5383 [Pelomyxa schiedti]